MKLETGNWKRLLQNASWPGRPAHETRTGFTLMELLLVMVVIAILGTIIMGSVTFITRVSRKRRAEVARHVLVTALTRYRSDYNKWPYGSLNPKERTVDKKTGEKTLEVTATGKDNAEIFGALREKNNANRIRYLDETTLYTVDNQGKPVALLRAGPGAKPLIYLSRETAAVKYFTVVINLDQDTVDVTTPELDQ